MSRARAALPWLLALAVIAAGLAWFLATHHRVEKIVPMPHRLRKAGRNSYSQPTSA